MKSIWSTTNFPSWNGTLTSKSSITPFSSSAALRRSTCRSGRSFFLITFNSSAASLALLSISLMRFTAAFPATSIGRWVSDTRSFALMRFSISSILRIPAFVAGVAVWMRRISPGSNPCSSASMPALLFLTSVPPISLRSYKPDCLEPCRNSSRTTSLPTGATLFPRSFDGALSGIIPFASGVSPS